MVEKHSPIPLHIQLANIIRQQVTEKEVLPGDRLPSERELCEKYQVSRITVRQAISTLSTEGLVYSSAGKGNYIVRPSLNEELQPLSSFTQDLERRGMRSASQVLGANVIPTDQYWSSIFSVPRGAELVSLQRLRLANDQPIAIQITHLPHHLCPSLLEFDFSRRSLYKILTNEYHLLLARSDTVIEAALATPEEARLLDLKRPAAVLISEQTTYLDNGTVIEVTRSIFHAERYKLHTHTF
jgi:GntR family transcriptional regulator